jgi:hypothetical protein
MKERAASDMAASIIAALAAAYCLIFLIDRPKLNSFPNAGRYKTVYFSIIAFGFVLGSLGALGKMPALDEIAVGIYKKLTGS